MQGARKNRSWTTSNGDLTRNKILEYAQNTDWFSITEAAKAIRVKRKTVQKYMGELDNKGLFAKRVRKQDIAARPPVEYLFQDNWNVLKNSPHPEVQYYVNRLKKLADIYRRGNIPTQDSLNDVLTELGDEILEVVNLLEQLNMIYNNPDMRKVNPFVKRMDSI